MPIEVIDDNRKYAEAITKALSDGALSLPDDVVIVGANYKPDGRDHRVDYNGIAVAEKAIKDGKKVILYSFETMPVLYLRQDFRRLFAEHYDKVRFVRQPVTLAEYATAFDKPQFENPALRFVTKRKEDEMKVIKLWHDIRYRRTDVLNEAREYFGVDGSDEEIEKLLAAKRGAIGTPHMQVLLAPNVFFPGVFCDVEGTYLIEGKVNEELRKELERYALEKPVNLWTGGDVEKIAYAVGNVRFPVLSKYDYRGAEVEIAIDDMPPEQFEREYGIKARQFRKV